MAALTAFNVKYQDPPGGGAARAALVTFQNVTAGDTFDASLLPIPFVTVTNAFGVALSGPAVTAALGTVASNTIVTINGTGMARNSVVLFIVGE